MTAGHVVAPGPPTWHRLVFDWHVDLLLVATLLVGAAYLISARRLARRGRRWPRRRTISFTAGLAAIAVATQSGLAGYDRVLFSLHVVQHVLLGMVAPLLLALGAPITLVLQATGRERQTSLLRLLRRRPVVVITHPLTAWLLFGGGLVVLYFSALYELSLRHEWVHALVHAHFVLAGCLFLWHVVGTDPIPHALGYGARLLYVAVALPFHALLGAALLGSDRVLAAGWYDEIARDWGASPLADQRTGAGILWLTGELFGVVLILLVVRQWMQADQREAARHDRRLEAA